MLYRIAHLLKDKFSWLWLFIEKINSQLFLLRYGGKLKTFSFKIIPDGYDIVPLEKVPTDRLISFFDQQPEETYVFFKPHDFDCKSIKRLQRNHAFLAYVLIDNANEKIAGYCFIRCFFHGQGFRGRMVDNNYRGKGLGTAMNKMLNEVGFSIGLQLFETVSKDNIASYRSALSASKVRVLKEMPNNVLYLEILPQ
jgi:RimJ/RimL family protein N-acetyltransferase